MDRRDRSRCLALAAVLLGASLPDAHGAVRLAARSIEVAPGPKRAPRRAPDGRYLIALDRRLTPSLRADLADAGARIEAYVPDDAVLARVPETAMAAVLGRPYVRAVLEMAPEDKVSRRIAEPSWDDDPALAGLLTVQL